MIEKECGKYRIWGRRKLDHQRQLLFIPCSWADTCLLIGHRAQFTAKFSRGYTSGSVAFKILYFSFSGEARHVHLSMGFFHSYGFSKIKESASLVSLVRYPRSLDVTSLSLEIWLLLKCAAALLIFYLMVSILLYSFYGNFSFDGWMGQGGPGKQH